MGDMLLKMDGVPSYVDDAGRLRIGTKPDTSFFPVAREILAPMRGLLCDECHGAGRDDAVDYHRPCPHCGGSGLARREIS